jgi:hypothetical protein
VVIAGTEFLRLLSTASENWIWHSFRELAGVSGGVSIAAL